MAAHAKEIIGYSQVQKLKYWDPIFIDYEWVNAVKLRAQTPVLIFLNGDRSYIYLFLATQENGERNKAPKIQTTENDDDTKKDLFNSIKKSLRSTNPGRHSCEVQFNHFTLNISHVLYGPAPILCKDLVRAFSSTTLDVALYEKEVRVVKPDTFGDEIAFIKIPGFKPAIFFDRALDEDHFSGYASTR